MSDDWGNDPLQSNAGDDWGNDPLQSAQSGPAPSQAQPQPTFTQGLVAGPGAFAKGALVNPVFGLAQMAEKYNPLNEIGSYVLQYVNPDIAKRKEEAEQAIPQAVETYYQSARRAAGKTGTDWGQIAGEVAGALAPTPMGKGEIAAKIPAIAEAIPDLAQEAPNVAKQAYDYVSRLVGDRTPEDIAAASKVAPARGMTAAEAIGTQGVKAAAALGRRAGSTGDALAAHLIGRKMEEPQNILSDYSEASGIDPRLAAGDLEGYVDLGRKTVAPMYEQALSGPNGVWNSTLEKLSQRPVVQKAMSDVETDLRNADIDPTGLGFTGRDPATGQFVQMPRPTAQAWDMVKKRLGMNVERDPFGRIVPDSRSPGNYHINLANSALTKELRNSIPGYGDALDASGDYLRVQKAFNDGADMIMKPSLTADKFASHFSSLPEAEQGAFKGGVGNKLFELSQNSRLGPKIFSRPIVQQKLRSMLGKEAANTFLDKMSALTDMGKTGARMMPGTGSITSDVLNATNEQNVGRHIFGALDTSAALTHLYTGNVPSAIARGTSALKWLNPLQREAIMPEPVRNVAGRLLMMTPEDFAEIMRRIETVGKQKAATPSGLPNAGLLGSSLYYNANQ